MTDDRYQRRNELGAGGMARVVEAWDRQLQRAVAIKEPRADAVGLDAGYHRRFLAEARKLALVRHPSVVEIYDVDAAHDPPRMIMELADGGSLRERLAVGAMAPARAIIVLRQLLAGLAAIHSAGLVHRDLKPDNILAFGDVYKIADFGIAKRGRERARRYVTPKYAAPEVQNGRDAGPSADVYSLGLIAYELVVGSRRFADLVAGSWSVAGRSWGSGTDDGTGAVDWTAWHRDASLALPPLDAEAAVPPAVAAAVARMGAKQPGERYADGESARGALELALAEAPSRRAAPSRAADASHELAAPEGGVVSYDAVTTRTAETETVPEPVDGRANTWNRSRTRAVARRGVLVAALAAVAGSAIGLTAFVRLGDREQVPDDALRQQALQLARDGDPARAVAALDRALRKAPSDPDLLDAGVRNQVALANYRRAEALVDRLAAVRPPTDPLVDYHRGLIALARAPYRAAAAVPALERAAGRAGVPGDAYFYLGFARVHGGDPRGATDAFERFLADDAGSEALAERARRYLAARDRSAAADAVTLYEHPLVLRGYRGTELPLGALRGRVVVVHLWASWCAPCAYEVPSLLRFFERDYPDLEARGLRLVSVSSDFAHGDLASFLGRRQDTGLPTGFPLYWDPDGELKRLLGLGSVLPQTVILDRRGRRLRQVTGAVDWDSERLVDQLASYL